MPRVFAYPALGLLLVKLAQRLLGDLATASELQTVLRGLPHNVTTEMDLELWQADDPDRRGSRTPPRRSPPGDVPALTEAYRRRTLPPVAQRTLTAFLRRYGHRAVAEIDLGMPRWAGDPSHIVGVIANYLRLNDPDLAPPRQFARGRAEAEAMLAELVARAAERHRLRGRVVGFALRRARQLVGLRESPKNLLIVALGLIRAQLEMVGRALAERGALDDRRRHLLPGPRARPGARWPASRCGIWWPSGGRRTRSSCAAGTSRGCCSATAPSPRRR